MGLVDPVLLALPSRLLQATHFHMEVLRRTVRCVHAGPSQYDREPTGMKVGEILRLATNDANVEPNMRRANIDALATHLQGALRFHSRVKTVRW